MTFPLSLRTPARAAAILSLLCLLPAAFSQETNIVGEVVSLLRERAVPEAALQQARRNAVQALVTTIDPGAVLLTPETHRARIHAEQGRDAENQPTPTLNKRERLPGDLGYLQINGLFEGAATAIDAALAPWEKERLPGIIIDLRNADGQDEEAVRLLAGRWCEGPALLYTRQPTDASPPTAVHAPESPRTPPIPVMILINERTSGAAELLAAVLRHGVRGAMLIGSTTAADPGVRRYHTLASGDVLYLTTNTLHLADDTVLDGTRGVQPDVQVVETNTPPPPIDAPEPAADDEPPPPIGDAERLRERVKDDAVLQRAADILLGLKALDFRMPPPGLDATEATP